MSICYQCERIATSREHVPAKAFFPKDKRQNLISVPSCSFHNEDTTLDDEYLRNFISSSKGLNKYATDIYLDKGVKSLNYSPALASELHRDPQFRNYLKNNEATKNLTYKVDKKRFDKVISKIAYGLFFHKFKLTWKTSFFITSNQILPDINRPDELSAIISNYYKLMERVKFEGNNKEIFKYSFIENTTNDYRILFLLFYENFDVFVIPC